MAFVWSSWGSPHGPGPALGREGGPRVPGDVPLQVEGIAEPIIAYVPGRRQVGQHLAIGAKPRKAGEDERGEVRIGIVQRREQRVHARGRADDRLNVALLAGFVRGRVERVREDEPEGRYGDDAKEQGDQQGPLRARDASVAHGPGGGRAVTWTPPR